MRQNGLYAVINMLMIADCFLFKRLTWYNFIAFPISGKIHGDIQVGLNISLDKMEMMLIDRSILKKEGV